VKLPRRKFLHLVAGAAALPARPGVASALNYPTRPVHILVGFAPAGATDICARLIGQWLSERLGQQFIVENRPGAGSNIATEGVVRAPADGYMLLVFGPPAAFNATLYNNLNFNFLRDIVPIGGIMRAPSLIRRFRPKLFPNSSPMPRRVPARLAWRRVVTGPHSISSASCST
jgi:tripartite-type tricarboxylate transporter receptor subunit TctC